MTAVTDTPITEEEFIDVINADIRGTLDTDDAAWLRAPDNVEHWYQALCSMKTDVESQLTQKRAEVMSKQSECLAKGDAGRQEWFDFKAESERWRAGAVRFKTGLEVKLAEARGLRNVRRTDRYTDLILTEREKAYREVARLRLAILTHRDHECDERCTDEECTADNDLWTILDTEPIL